MSIDEILEGVLLSEGEGKPPYLVPGDKGGRTSWGISEKYHPEEWLNGPPSRARAKQILYQQYAKPWEGILDPDLRAQLVDIAVLHGPSKCLMWLKEGAGIEIRISDVVGSVNTAWNALGWDTPHHKIVNNALVAARLGWIDRYTDENPDQTKFKNGWSNRALRFLVRE